MLEIGEVLDNKYKILNVIGRGGMSTVYLAINEAANRPWAVKEVRRDGKGFDDVFRESLEQELALMRTLSHPNLPGIADVIQRDDSILIVMDYIDGITLGRKMDQEGPLLQEDVIQYGQTLCDVLMYLHAQEPAVIYRDMKPDNIMLTSDGHIMLIDFGIARTFKPGRTGDTICLGSEKYAAPEQYMSECQTDTRTDIYNLGMTMYHLVTGHTELAGPYRTYPIRSFNPSLSAGLEKIILKATNPDPDKRYQTAGQLRYDLAHYRELDSRTRQNAFLSVASFAVASMLACLTLLTSNYMKGQARDLLEQSETDFIDMAKGALTETERTENILSAQQMAPTSNDALMTLLELDSEDGDYSVAEDEAMRQILHERIGDSETVETVLRQNDHEYAVFAYYLGIAYFYRYEGEGNKQMAGKWFREAAKSGELSEPQTFRAQRLSEICGYYSRLGVTDETGDSHIRYAGYWEDLKAVASGDIADADNTTTALIIYSETCAQIYNNAYNFMKESVPLIEIAELLDDVESHLDSDFGNMGPADEERLMPMMEQTRENMTLARQEIEAAYKLAVKP